MRKLLALLLLAVTPCFADSLGTVSSVETIVDCNQVNWCGGGVPNKTIYKLTISGCPGYAGQGILPDQSAVIGINFPTGTPIGTVTHMTGGGNNTYFDQQFSQGTYLISSELTAGYITVQLGFPTAPVNSGTNAGWITGNQGMRALACRPATVLSWVNANLNPPGAPLCHIGNSGGASAGAYFLEFYSLPLKFVELASGPTFSDFSNGCSQNSLTVPTPCGEGNQPLQYSVPTARKEVDPSYGASAACSLHLSAMQPHFLHDHLLAADANFSSFPDTDMILGTLDTSVAVGQSATWLASAPLSVSVTCCPTCGHAIAGNLSGANMILTNVVNRCTP